MTFLQARRAIIENARRQVELATRLIRDGIYDSACFHAMTAIEECGKLSWLRFAEVELRLDLGRIEILRVVAQEYTR